MAFNRPLDGETAGEVAKLFVECIVAAGYDPAAREALAGKKNLRLAGIGADDLRQKPAGNSNESPAGCWHRIRTLADSAKADLKVASKRRPTSEEIHTMLFAWKVVKHVKSNAIVFARGGRTLGVGAGQMSRVESVRIAVMKRRIHLPAASLRPMRFFPSLTASRRPRVPEPRL